MKTISFVILHYGDWQATDRCIQSILKMKQQEQVHIVIVDNDIEQPDAQRRSKHQRYVANKYIHILMIRGNGGFSYANNQGYIFARNELKSEFILVLNNDIEFTQLEFIELLENFYRKYPCHVLGPDIVREANKEHQNPMDSRIRTAKEAEYTIRMNRLVLKFYPVLYPVLYWQNKQAEYKRIQQKESNASYYKKVQKDIVPFGACLIFTPLFVEKEEKAFEPETQFYYEEYILALRCQRKSYCIMYDPGMRVMHESGGATKYSLKTEFRRIKYMMKQTADACEVYLAYIGRGNKQ